MADLSGMRLQDLPETREEVERIGKIVGRDAVMLLGKDATETAFKKEPLDQFRVLHLAVHGFADTQYPERSALVLGTDPKSSDDGLLQVREIIRLRLNAELTTLSKDAVIDLHRDTIFSWIKRDVPRLPTLDFVQQRGDFGSDGCVRDVGQMILDA
jgi:hypothetical protein